MLFEGDTVAAKVKYRNDAIMQKIYNKVVRAVARAVREQEVEHLKEDMIPLVLPGSARVSRDPVFISHFPNHRY